MSFRIPVIVALFLVPAMSLAADPPSDIAVKIDIPEICKDGKVILPRTLENRYPDYDRFFVVLENVSSKTIFLLGQDWQALSFEATDDSGRKTVIRHVPEMTNGKPPANIRLKPGEVSVRVIDYGARKYGQQAEWEPFPFPHDPHISETSRKITLRAIYRQAAPAIGAKPDYWVGRAISKPVEVLLEDNALHQTGISREAIADGIEMRLSVMMTNRETEFEVAFKNQGTNDVCLNLGEMLANGKVQIPDKVQLRLKDSSGVAWQWVFPLAGVAGRVDDFVVPLRQGSSYTVRIPLGQFFSADYRRHDPELAPGRYELSAEFQGTGAGNINLDMQGIALMHFWKGKLEEGIVTEIR